ncbi:hypothetical protein NUW58_g8344 [Xylaria curta]|uniref:Uncharacterized protein n=1 Tax=Xylaria curta TaxID=42375 RepID=A0ACC1N9E2_9PEZI|nr:hypothetical protein NUW58_g8344 [Xylaria curta]
MRVAIAGYSDLAHYICEEFVKAGHELVILTRKHKPQLESQGVTQAVTDYTLSSLRAPLADCEVLISTISDFSSIYIDIHKTLIQACHESPKCKRFIPSEFALNIEAYPDQPGFYYAPHEPIREMLRNQTDIEWTLVCVGWLADYFLPTKNRYIKDIGEFHPVNWGGALALLVEAPQGSWEPYTFMSGERSCWNDATNLAKQKHRLDTPIEHISLHKVAEMIKTAKDEDTMILADYYLLSISQACANPPDKVQAQREKYFPGVRFRTLQEGLSHLDEHPDSIA